MSSGISSRFQLLSQGTRQVAHALLTRPPLIRPRRDFTVRLECVMHAASVHPEPGSNSLKNCISTDISVGCYQLVRVILYSITILKEFFKIQKNFRSLLVHFVVVQFSMSYPLSLTATALLLYHYSLPLSIPFLKKIQFVETNNQSLTRSG